MDDQHSEPLAPPVPAQPLVDSAVEANDPHRPSVEPGNDVQPDPDGEPTRGEGGEEGAEPYDGGEIPRTGDETLREEDRDPLNEELDR